MKQSMKAWKPVLHGLVSFKQIVQDSSIHQKFIAHVDRNNPVSLFKSIKSGTDVLVLIGPEGDFTNEEVSLSEKHGFIKVSLGNSRLRTETAGIVACNSIHLANEIH
jgi:16S rRNA (uracil1498-N3)-methyltransferase